MPGFGYSIGDAVLLSQLAWRAVDNSRKACGEHDELMHKVSCLRNVLQRLEIELKNDSSPLNRPNDPYHEELQHITRGCRRVLGTMDQILQKYNALSKEERSGRKLWQQIRFGNGKMGSLIDLRSKIVYYTTAMSLFLNMVCIGSVGNIERQINESGSDPLCFCVILAT